MFLSVLEIFKIFFRKSEEYFLYKKHCFYFSPWTWKQSEEDTEEKKKEKKNLTCETPKVMEHGEAQIGVNVGFKQPHSSSYLGVINFENF